MKGKSSDVDHPEAAFTLNAEDRFHSIIVSDGVRYDVAPEHETIITFFVIHRVSGLYDLFHVLKTFKGDKCVSRQVQSKTGIGAARIDKEITDISRVFAKGIQDATGFKIKWNTLKLSDVPDMKDQVHRIHAWGRVGVRVAADIPPISLN